MTFYGTSPNAVKTQIWIAISVHLLVAIARKRTEEGRPLHSFRTLLTDLATLTKNTVKVEGTEILRTVRRAHRAPAAGLQAP